MTEVAVEDMPPVAFRPYSFLLDNTSVEPVVRRKGYGRMELIHSSERVRLSITFKLTGRKWAWVGSTLTVDGKRVPLASSWEVYVAIFKDPDNGRRNYVPPGARKAVLPEFSPVDEEHAPTVVTQAARDLRNMVGGGRDLSVKVGIEDSRRYVLAVTNNEDESKIVYFFAPGDGGWRVEGLTLVSPTGYDITDHQGDKIEDYILEFLGAESRQAQHSTPILGRKEQGHASNSVLVRRATVFRV